MIVGSVARMGALVGVLAAVTALTACGSDDDSSEPAATAAAATSSAAQPGKGLKLAYVSRSQGGTSYFVDEANGMKEAARKLGASMTVQFTNSADEQVAAVDTLIGRGIDGLIITIQDPKIGPAVASKAKAANVPLLATDNVFNGADSKPVPVVEVDGKGLGTAVGKAAADYYKQLSFPDDGAGVKIASVELPTLQTCNDRTQGAAEAFLQAVPGFPKQNVVKVEYDGTMDKELNAMTATLQKQRSATRWLTWSCNDEGVVGVLKALGNTGHSIDKTIGVGLGGELNCQVWDGGKPTAYRASIALEPANEGRIAVETMVKALSSKSDLPATTNFPGKLVTKDDYKTVKSC